MPSRDAEQPARRDLAALIGPLGRALARAEEPILRRHGLSMWGYSVLLALTGQPTRSQAALADQIGADRTRIIPVLDDLQAGGLIERAPDPGDRRVRLLSITPSGLRACRGAQREIQQQEELLLELLPAADRVVLVRALAVLFEQVRLGCWPPA